MSSEQEQGDLVVECADRQEIALNYFSELAADERAAFMRAADAGDANADAAGDFERRAAVTFHAADPTGPDGDVVLPLAILSDGRGVILPAGEIGLFAGSGGSGKSRLSLQVGVAAAGVPAATAEPIPDGTLRVASGPVVLCSYEDAAPWIAWRARRVARWLDDRAGTTHHTRAVTDPERLSVAAVDAPLFGVTLGAGREAIPGPLASWRPLWDHAAAIGARLVIIDPVALAGQWDGYSPLPVGAFIAAIRRELRALTDPCGALLVCHTTKAARAGVQDADRTGAEAIVGSAAWVDRARAALMLDAIQKGQGRKRLSVAKANYAAQRILCDVQSVNDGTGRPLVFAVAPSDARAGGDDDLEGQAHATQGIRDGDPPV